jgi:preprotein translocase subunit SecY
MQIVLYMSALAVWILVACIIWCAAGLMFLSPRTRSSAWPMSLAMASTFPFVFAYQIIAVPAVIVMLLGAATLSWFLEPGVSTTENPVTIGGAIVAVLGSVVVVLVSSVAGFFDGWRAGWRLARGCSIKEVLSDTIAKKCFDRLKPRRT